MSSSNSPTYASEQATQASMERLSIRQGGAPARGPTYTLTYSNAIPPSPQDTIFVTQAKSLHFDWRMYRYNKGGKLKSFTSPIRSRRIAPDLELLRIDMEARREEILQFIESTDNVEHDGAILVDIMQRVDEINGKLAEDPELRKFYEYQAAIAVMPKSDRGFEQVNLRNWVVAERVDDIEWDLEHLLEECQKLNAAGQSPRSEEVQGLKWLHDDIEERIQQVQTDCAEQIQETSVWFGEPESSIPPMEPLDEVELTLSRVRAGLRNVQLPKYGKDKGKLSANLKQKASQSLSLLSASRKTKDAGDIGSPDPDAEVEDLVRRCSDWHARWRRTGWCAIHEVLDKLETNRKTLSNLVRRLQHRLENERGFVSSRRLLFRTSGNLLESWHHERNGSFPNPPQNMAWVNRPTLDEIAVLKYRHREYTQASIIELFSDQDHLALGLGTTVQDLVGKLRRTPAVEMHDRRVALVPLSLFRMVEMVDFDVHALECRMKRLVYSPPEQKPNPLGTDAVRREISPLVVARLQMTQAYVVEQMSRELPLMEAIDKVAEKQNDIRTRQPIPVDGHAKVYSKQLLKGMFLYLDSDFTF